MHLNDDIWATILGRYLDLASVAALTATSQYFRALSQVPSALTDVRYFLFMRNTILEGCMPTQRLWSWLPELVRLDATEKAAFGYGDRVFTEETGNVTGSGPIFLYGPEYGITDRSLWAKSFKKSANRIFLWSGFPRRGEDVIQPRRYGFTPLHYAAYGGNILALRTLLKRGATVDQQDSSGRTLLHIAAASGSMDVVLTLIQRYVIESMIDINAYDKWNRTALHYAAACGHGGIVQLLLQAGCELPLEQNNDAESTSGRWKRSLESPFALAARSGDASSVPYLWSAYTARGIIRPLEYFYEATKYSPLHIAALNGHTEFVRSLLNILAEDETEPGFASGERGSVDTCVVTLYRVLNHGSVAADILPLSALHCAAAEGHNDIVSMLLNAGADPNGPRGFRNLEAFINAVWSPLHWAAVNLHTEVVSSLLKSGADPHGKRFVGDIEGGEYSPLEYVEGLPKSGKGIAIRKLLKRNGAKCNNKLTKVRSNRKVAVPELYEGRDAPFFTKLDQGS
ncbi:hypothetical protein HDU86_005559 [Geranomyces michiganensis]|nr:hypothetical protein HDU86_005559 [Geranomyces michiganensis]